jgi:hypothetical protein
VKVRRDIWRLKIVKGRTLGKMLGKTVNWEQLNDMEKNRRILALLFLIVFLAIAFGIRGQVPEGRFLVRKETSREMVFVVDGFLGQNKSADDIRLDSSKCRVLYNGCGKLFTVSRDDDFLYYLDSIESNKLNQCSESNLGSVKFSNFLRHKAKGDHRSLMSLLELGGTELKCNESYCLVYHLGLRLFRGLEEKGEVIHPRGNFIGGKWSLDFFREKYLILIGRYYEPDAGFECHIYFFDLESKQLMWSHKLQNDQQPLDIKVVGEHVYVVFRKVSPKGYSIPPPPSRCIVARIGSLGKVPEVTFRMVEGFDAEIIEIL